MSPAPETTDHSDYQSLIQGQIATGTHTSAYKRVAPNWQQTSQFNFHFITIYLRDNTAEAELADGMLFTVHLESGEVQNIE